MVQACNSKLGGITGGLHKLLKSLFRICPYGLPYWGDMRELSTSS